jgi:hypothetical protein
MLVVVDNTDTQRALIWKDGRLFAIVGAGRHAFWKTPAVIDVEVFDIAQFRFDAPEAAGDLPAPGRRRSTSTAYRSSRTKMFCCSVTAC